MEQTTTNAPRARWLPNVLLLVGGAVLALVMGEVIVRQVLGQSMVLSPRYHTKALYEGYTLRRLRPNTTFWHTTGDGKFKFVTNAQGFRDQRDYSYQKDPTRLRILSLGDSHTEGFEVRQEMTFSAALERYLKGRGLDAEVFNMGISGFSTAEALAFLEAEAVRYQPDVILLGFFANDFEDNIKSGLFTLRNNTLVPEKTYHIPGVRILDIMNSVAPLRWLSENSYFYSFVLNTVWERAKDALLQEAQVRVSREYAVPTEDVSAIQQKLTLALLQRMYAFCKSRNIKLVILDIPTISSQRQFVSSVPRELQQAFRNASDKLIDSDTVLERYRYAAQIHNAHGSHISEFTHAVLAVAGGEEVERLFQHRVNRNRPLDTHASGRMTELLNNPN